MHVTVHLSILSMDRRLKGSAFKVIMKAALVYKYDMNISYFLKSFSHYQNVINKRAEHDLVNMLPTNVNLCKVNKRLR